MQRYLVGGIYGFLFLLPLINFTANGSSPWEFPKLCFSVAAITLLFSAFIFWKLRSSFLEFRFNKVLLLSSLFTFSSLISYFLSANSYLSFWGDKLLPSDSMVTILAAFLLSVLILQLEFNRKNFYFLFLGILMLQTACGLIQIFDVNLPWWGFHYAVFGTQGQPVAYATLLGCLTPFACPYFFRKNNRPAETIASGALLFFTNFVILHTGSRMPLAVLWLTFLLIGIYYFLHRSRFHSVKKIIALFLIVSASTSLFQIQKSDSEIQSKLSSEMVNKGFETRKLVLQSGIDAWKEKPVFGYGPQMFLTAHRPYQTAEINLFEYWENGWIKAHNQLGDLLVNQGLSGLLITLFLFLFLLTKAAKLYFKKDADESDAISLAVFAGYNYLFLANMTAFNMLTTQILFAVFPVLFSVFQNDVQKKFFNLRGAIRSAALGISFLAATLLLLNTYGVWKSDVLIQTWLRNQKINADKLKSLELTLQASALNPADCVNSFSVGRITTEMLGRNYKSLTPADLQNTLQAIDENMNQCMNLSPGIIHYVQLTAEVYQELYFRGVINSGEKALNYYEEVLKVTPYHPKIISEMGRIQLQAGNETAFIESELKSLHLKPDYVPAYIELLQSYYKKNDNAAVSALTEKFSQAKFQSPEFVPMILDLVAIAEENHDGRAKEVFQNAYDQFKYLIPAVKKI